MDTYERLKKLEDENNKEIQRLRRELRRMRLQLLGIILSIIISFAGIALLVIYGNWMIATGVFLFVWGYSQGNKSKGAKQ